jgi:hypothetical protein
MVGVVAYLSAILKILYKVDGVMYNISNTDHSGLNREYSPRSAQRALDLPLGIPS